MRRQYGIWIDHRKAVIVELRVADTRVQTLKSGLRPHVRMAGGSRSRTRFGPQDVASETRRDRRYDNELKDYFERVIGKLGQVESLLVLGPGAAKKEFLSVLGASGHHVGTATELLTTDKLTEAQIVERVNAHFGRHPARKIRWRFADYNLPMGMPHSRRNLLAVR